MSLIVVVDNVAKVFNEILTSWDASRYDLSGDFPLKLRECSRRKANLSPVVDVILISQFAFSTIETLDFPQKKFHN